MSIQEGTAPQQIELAEQLYRVWRSNSPDKPDSDPSSPGYAGWTNDWADEPEGIKAQWRALAEVYARLSLFQAETSAHGRIVSQLQELCAEITGHLEVRIAREFEAQAAQSRNPDSKSDMVWNTETHRRFGVIATLREIQGKVENMTEHRVEALARF